MGYIKGIQMKQKTITLALLAVTSLSSCLAFSDDIPELTDRILDSKASDSSKNNDQLKLDKVVIHDEIINDRSNEVDKLLKIYRGEDLVAQKKQTESLAWSGITDTRVYDEIERLLIKTNEKPTVDRIKNDATSWFLKGLAYSGNHKYLSTLQKVRDETKNYKHKKYANEALDFLPRYTEWNPIINSTSEWNVNQSGKINRFANMIRSDVPRLKELAAKRTYGEGIKSPYLLEVIEKELLAHCADKDKTSRFGTTYGFMSKALGASGDKKYAQTIRTVYDQAYNKKLKRLAKKHLTEFDLK